MASQATRQRKGGGMAAPRSGDLLPVANMGTAIAMATTKPQTPSKPTRTLRPAVIKEAKVKRARFGTGPFDQHWLNMDCCGLFCAGLTYMLHLYGVYAVCLILIPPWMSTVDEDGVRTLSLMGHFHRTAFTVTAVLAVYAHFKAMTTNPGAVPPDAIPLEEMQELLNMNTKDSNEEANGENTSSLMKEDTPQPTPRKGRRLCRRCNSFKPKRAHHCSICKRCIIKMDRKCILELLDIHDYGFDENTPLDSLLLTHSSSMHVCTRRWIPPPTNKFGYLCNLWNRFRPLPLGKQLRRYWQPQVLFAIYFLHGFVLFLLDWSLDHSVFRLFGPPRTRPNHSLHLP